MKSVPRSPSPPLLSRSARETEPPIRSIFQWKKQRPPLWAMVPHRRPHFNLRRAGVPVRRSPPRMTAPPRPGRSRMMPAMPRPFTRS